MIMPGAPYVLVEHQSEEGPSGGQLHEPKCCQQTALPRSSPVGASRLLPVISFSAIRLIQAYPQASAPKSVTCTSSYSQ